MPMLVHVMVSLVSLFPVFCLGIGGSPYNRQSLWTYLQVDYLPCRLRYAVESLW